MIHATAVGEVDLVGQASKGETVIQLRLRDGCRQELDRCPDGEQAALGSAFFRAELPDSDRRSAIELKTRCLFDADHREYMATRWSTRPDVAKSSSAHMTRPSSRSVWRVRRRTYPSRTGAPPGRA